MPGWEVGGVHGGTCMAAAPGWCQAGNLAAPGCTHTPLSMLYLGVD